MLFRLFLQTIVILTSLFSGLALSTENEDDALDIFGFAKVTSGLSESQRSWLNGGFGRLDLGDINGESASFIDAEIQIAAAWSVSDSTLVYVHTRAREEDAWASTHSFGLVEAFVQQAIYENEDSLFNFQLGQVFMPTSQENTDELWQSPYTLNFSTWNSWIAQEFRPIGVQLNYEKETQEGDQWLANFGLFQGNDSFGSQLAWGGWRISNRLSVTNEVLPLGQLFTLENGGAFADQRDDGSKPFGEDLDSNVGFNAQLGFRALDSFNIKISYVDNQGDRAIYKGEYAWETRFAHVGFNYPISENWEILGELASGETGMGDGIAMVQVDFDSAYLMASWNKEAHRVSLRVESFGIDEVDNSVAEDNTDKGSAWTLAWFYHLDESVRFAAEFLVIDAENAGQAQSGFSGIVTEKLLTLEARLIFD